MNNLSILPRLMILLPTIGMRNLGIRKEVDPVYATNNGKLAIVGKINLYLHLRSSTSSLNPKKIMKQIDNKAAL